MVIIVSHIALARMGARKRYGEKAGESVFVTVEFSKMNDCFMEAE